MKLIRTFSLVLSLTAVLTGVVNAAQLMARFAGRDVEALGATVESTSQSPIPAQSLPPNGYAGIELLKSNEQDLFAKFARTSRSRLMSGGGEAQEGYCYTSSNSLYVAFSLAASSQFNVVQLSTKPLGGTCAPISASLNKCLGVFCLGQSRSEVERQLGIQPVGGVVSDESLEVVYYHYNVPMSPSELEKFAAFNISEVPVDHNLWFIFDSEGLYYIGIWRNEDLP